MSDALCPNADQIEAWNDGIGRTWVANADALNRQIQPIGRAAMEAGGVVEGDSVLDIGCGCGQTSLEIAGLVGPVGWVHGVDISALMIGEASAAARMKGVENVSFEIADAQTTKLRIGAYDLLFSRFGVMFFDNPVAAFVNLRTALKKGGRIAFCCWRGLPENIWMSAPMRAAAEVLPPDQSPAPDPFAPGPFAFADSDRLRDIMRVAGFANISIEKWDGQIGAGSFETSVELALSVGPLGARLRDMKASEALRDAVRGSVRGALQPFKTDAGDMRAPAAAWIVRADG